MARSNFSFGKIGTREKAWIILWAAVILSIGFLNFRFKPGMQKISAVQKQIASLGKEKQNLIAKQPDMEKRKKMMSDLKKEIADRYEELTGVEQKLVDIRNVDELLDSFVKDRSKFEILLNSIRPVQQKEPSAVETQNPSKKQQMVDPYRKLRIQLDIFSTFQGLVNYIAFLEQMRPYQEVEGIKVKVEGKEVSRPHAVFLVSVLMGESQEVKEAQRKEIFGVLEDIATREKKDPFLTGDKPKEVVQAVGLELTGIFSEGGRPVAAMINNEIYHVGDVVDNKRVVTIEGNRVVLEYGNRRFVLTPAHAAVEGPK